MNNLPKSQQRMDDHSQNLMLRLSKNQDIQNFSTEDDKVDFNNLSVIVKEEQGFQVGMQDIIILSSAEDADEQMNIEIRETTERLARDQQIANKKRQQSNKNNLKDLAQIKAIMQDNPEMMNESITYLTTLAEQAQRTALAKKAVIKYNSITKYFSQIFMFGSTLAFYTFSTALLNNRLLEIVQDFHQFQSNYPPWMRIQIQTLSHFFKVFHEFEQYLPRRSHLFYLNKCMKKIIEVLKIEPKQFKQLRKIYFQQMYRIAHFEQKFNLRFLAQTYVFILLKQKFLAPQKNHNIDQIEKAAQKLKIHKQEAMLKSICKTQPQDKYALSELYANANGNANRQKLQKMGKDKSKSAKLAIIYEKMMELEKLGIIKTERMDQLNKVYEEKIDYQDFNKYKEKKKKLLRKYNNDLSELKDDLITKQLIRNSNCSLEEVLQKIQNLSRIFIERQYFEGNLHRLLTKEVHYQQLKYLNRVFKGINQHKEKVTVIFVDCSSVTEGKDSTLIAVNITKNLILCKKSRGRLHFFEEVLLLFKAMRPSIIIIFDEQFPFSDKVQKLREVESLRLKHDLFFLPRASQSSNLCKVIWDSIGLELRKRLIESCDWKELSKGTDCIDLRMIKEEEQQSEREPDTHFPRFQCKRENDFNSSYLFSQSLIMENLQARSANDLRLALTRLLQFNNKQLFRKWQ